MDNQVVEEEGLFFSFFSGAHHVARAFMQNKCAMGVNCYAFAAQPSLLFFSPRLISWEHFMIKSLH